MKTIEPNAFMWPSVCYVVQVDCFSKFKCAVYYSVQGRSNF